MRFRRPPGNAPGGLRTAFGPGRPGYRATLLRIVRSGVGSSAHHRTET
ncbi:hypothetical protein BZL30_2781 [Mycobacterium kansasii]|uniref:Uncharacterized protein n=1 Tax=Mycobacterium kansasii TaxID=1768 RepID=A0A1V3XJT4_MYCKA|nr:hypothetical protein MKSMC1_51660 [Mycobacterium kansasii]OOK79392.1 hypothetical protein BZL30_2781 [Mycobacterium kansasii]